MPAATTPDGARYQAHDVEEHLLSSSTIGQVFRIKVQRPMSRVDDSERFPVLYTTDSDEFFAAYATLANNLQLLAEVPRFILVGIGYREAGAAPALRMRDFLPQAIRTHYHLEIEQVARSPLVSGLLDLKAVTQTTDAADFLGFIRQELMPFISAHYPVVPNDNNYCGYSAGGTFGLYTLFTQPDTFKRYILGSPATSYGGHHFGIDLAKEFIGSGRAMNAKVFASVGELEEFMSGFGPFDLVSGLYLLVKFLNGAAIPGLDLTQRVFPNETHSTAWSPAFSHGLKALFGPVGQVPYWPEYLKRR